MNYKNVDKETYYRKGVFKHFTQDCKCSTWNEDGIHNGWVP